MTTVLERRNKLALKAEQSIVVILYKTWYPNVFEGDNNVKFTCSYVVNFENVFQGTSKSNGSKVDNTQHYQSRGCQIHSPILQSFI